MAVRLQRGRVHRRSQRRGDKVPLPRQYHRDPMDPETRGRHHQRLTSGQDTRSARCGESRTPGAGGGPRETTGGDTGTAPAGLPHENWLRVMQLADAMKKARGKLPQDAAGPATFRVLRYVAKITINPSNASG